MKHWGNGQNTDSVLSTIWSTMDPKKRPKTVIFPDALFLHFPWDLPKFSAEGPITNAQKGACLRGPIPKVLIMRWKKVLTNETPCMFTFVFTFTFYVLTLVVLLLKKLLFYFATSASTSIFLFSSVTFTLNLYFSFCHSFFTCSLFVVLQKIHKTL